MHLSSCGEKRYMITNKSEFESNENRVMTLRHFRVEVADQHVNIPVHQPLRCWIFIFVGLVAGPSELIMCGVE